MVNSRDFVAMSPASQKEARKSIKETISGHNFVLYLKKVLLILNPIDELITRFQSDSVPVSDVYVSFLNLPLKFETEKAMSNLTEIEINYIQEQWRRKNFV